MEQQIQIAEHEEFGKIRFLEIDGETWFVGKDVADALGYNEPHKAIVRHVDNEDGMKHPVLSDGGFQKTWIVNESGLYSLILSSKLPTARIFKRWVTSQVLPQIRRTGQYIPAGKAFNSTATLTELCRNFLAYQEEYAKLHGHVEELTPKARYHDLILQTKNTVPISVIAKDYGMSAVAFNNLLHDLHIQYRINSGKTWLLYQEHADQGYTKTRTYWVNDHTCATHTSWTQKGRLFLYNRLLEAGIAPMMEGHLLEEVAANR